MRRGLLVFALAAATATSGPYVWQAIVEAPGHVESSWVRWRTAVPPRRLPLRLADFEKYPRASFGFVYGSDRVHGLDTFSGTFTAARLEKPDTTIALRLSSADLDTIYRAMIEMRFFDLPEPHPPFEGDTNAAITHVQPRRLEVRAGAARKLIRIPNGLSKGVPSDDWKRLYGLLRLIRDKLESHTDYRTLHSPKVHGA